MATLLIPLRDYLEPSIQNSSYTAAKIFPLLFVKLHANINTRWQNSQHGSAPDSHPSSNVMSQDLMSSHSFPSFLLNTSKHCRYHQLCKTHKSLSRAVSFHRNQKPLLYSSECRLLLDHLRSRTCVQNFQLIQALRPRQYVHALKSRTSSPRESDRTQHF